MDRNSVDTKGFTAIEFLIFISAIALVIAFAIPAARSAFFQSSLDQAKDITEESIKCARRTARMYKTDVLMRIESDRLPANDAITLSLPNLQQDQVLNRVHKEFALPEGVDITSDEMTILFDPAGKADWPATVMLVSQAEDSPVERLRIE